MSIHNENNEPLISVLFMCRCSTDLHDLNSPSIVTFFNSAMNYIEEEHRNKFEFLIRLDTDDIVAKKEIIDNQILKKYPFVIKPFFHNRWEGLHTAHYSATSLLLRKNPNSKFILFAGSDSKFYSSFANSILPVLEENKNNKYAFLVYSNHFQTINKLNRLPHYRTSPDKWMFGSVIDPYPFVTSKICEICSIIGWCRNYDTWFALLNRILFTNYNIHLQKEIKTPIIVRNNAQSHHFISKDADFFSTYNDFIIAETPENHFYYNLVEQQAKNIYLNIKDDGLLDKYTIK